MKDLVNSFLCERKPVSHSNIHVGRNFLCLQGHFKSICLHKKFIIQVQLNGIWFTYFILRTQNCYIFLSMTRKENIDHHFPAISKNENFQLKIYQEVIKEHKRRK